MLPDSSELSSISNSFRRGRGYAPRSFTVGFRSCSPTCPSCSDPGLPIHYDIAPRNIKRVFVWDDFDNLPGSQSESPHESEPFCRAIDYEAGKPFRNSFKINDKTSTLFSELIRSRSSEAFSVFV